MSTESSLVQVPKTFTFEQYRLMGLQEQHAEVDGAFAVISESYTATGMRYGVPAVIDTGKFRPRKGDPIYIRIDKVINSQPWKAYCDKYSPQHDHSFMSRAFSLVHPDYRDFLTRFYTERYRDPSPTVQDYLLILTQIMSIEKIFQEKVDIGPSAFAYPWIYELMRACYKIRIDYATKKHAINYSALVHHWSDLKKDIEHKEARNHFHEKAEQLRNSPLPTPLDPLPPGTPKIIVLGQGDNHANV